MNRLNVKRIAVLASALLMGVAVAGQVSFSSIPIINSAGQPAVQIVVGSGAKPSDGVVAANIAAVIGNLAFTSTPVTATVSGTSGLTCVPASTSTCAVSNQQVYIGESGTSAPSGTYGFTALIGSVLNAGITLGSSTNSKSLQSGNSYAYQETTSTTTSPAASPYTAAGYVPTAQSVVGNNNGGGVSFTSFTKSAYDNVLQVTSTNLPSLLSNSGTYSESEYLWLTGFPVYDQASGVANYALIDAAGAYQVVFNKPIHEPYYNGASSCTAGCAAGTNSVVNAQFSLLGQDWTVVSYALPTGTVSSTATVHGGKLSLASSLTSLTTVSVGHNLTSGNFTVQVADLGQASNGISPAIINVYYKGVLTNSSSLNPSGTPYAFNVSGTKLYVKVNSTAAGLYAYQKWAKLQLYANVYNVTDGQAFNKTNNPGWNINLLWTNATGGGHPTDLQSIVLYNTTPVSQLTAGQSFNFVQNPKVYKITLVGDTLGSNYDAVTATSTFTGSVTYANLGTQSATGTGAITNVTEPAQELTITSQIPNAFTYAGQTNNTVTYLLTGYELNELGTSFATPLVSGVGAPVNVVLSVTAGYPTANYISTTNPLSVIVTGYTSNTATSAQSTTLTFNGVGAANSMMTAGNFYNITSIKLSGRALPGISLSAVAWDAANTANSVPLATLNSIAPVVIYPQSSKVYMGASASTSTNYNQYNGQPTEAFSFSSTSVAKSSGNYWQFFTYNMPETNVPGSTSSTDAFAFGIVNSTGGVTASPLFILNYSVANTHTNETYISSSGASFDVKQGFVTERGSKLASVYPTSLTFNIAKAVDELQFIVSPIATNIVTTQKTVGPLTVGQSIPGVSNMTIASVNATCSFSGSTGCTVSGVSGLSATPSVSSAITNVPLNTATNPLVVLDSDATAGTLIVVGSKYVNSVAQQIFAQNPSFDSSFGPSSVVVQAFGSNRILVAGYTAAQTVQAGNQFIQALLSAASS